MNIFKEKCIELRRSDHTILEISKITGRAKSSIYFHIKNIPLSLEKQKQIKNNNSLRISAFSIAKKGKSERKFKKFTKWNKELVNLVSHLIFDGEIKHSGCVYNNRNQALLDKVETSMSHLYEFRPIKYTNPLTGVKRISYFNVALAIYLKEKSVELLKKISNLPKLLKKEFLISFFDDEGCIDFRIYRNLRRVRGYQKDVKILLLVQKLLKDFGIESAIHKPNEVVIIGKSNLEKFQKEINFSSGVYINGNRSNSIWKKSIEKRYLLAQAIKSFKK
jgi:hypothetical protein